MQSGLWFLMSQDNLVLNYYSPGLLKNITAAARHSPFASLWLVVHWSFVEISRIMAAKTPKILYRS